MRPEHVAVVLHRPKYPENIGAAARAVRNMGMGRLIVVAPENDDLKRIHTLATHAAADVVDDMIRHDSLQSALAPFHYVVGTTARLGGQRHLISSPTQMARQLIPISQENQVAMVFGPEDRGLTNEELRLCHLLVNIPTAEFASLNLAQAVMVISYELFKASLPAPKTPTPRLASRHELDGMYDQIKEILLSIHYILPDNPDYWMNKIRHFLSRLKLRAGEVSIIRGICRQMGWYAGKCYQDGRLGNPPPPPFEKEKSA